MSDAERRERSTLKRRGSGILETEKQAEPRLRSERWRRAHGIMPRKLAQRPWLALCVSRSAYYRRRKQARCTAGVASALAKQCIGYRLWRCARRYRREHVRDLTGRALRIFTVDADA